MPNSKTKKWTLENTKAGNNLRVVFLVSRLKDNKDVEGFKPRKKAFVTEKSNDELYEDFYDFMNKGVDNEFSRLYISVNLRDPEKVRKALIHNLIDDSEYSLAHLNSKVASIAAKRENALEKKWMFDFDCEDHDKLIEFISDIMICDEKVEIGYIKTPHGYAVVTSRGFNARFIDGTLLLEKWKDIVTLKRDDLLCIAYGTEGGNCSLIKTNKYSLFDTLDNNLKNELRNAFGNLFTKNL